MRLPIHYSDDYVMADGPETTVTKAGLVAAAAVADLPDGIELRAPRPATEHELRRIHDDAYVTAVLTGTPRILATGGLGQWSQDLVDSVLATTGGMRDATIIAMTTGGVAGSLSSGLHHAHIGFGTGFCTFNGLALAAVTALEMGAESVGILDVDAHCGGGTFEILGSDARVIFADVSTSSFDVWRSSERRHLCSVDKDPTSYLDRVQVALDHLDGVDLVIHNAGMDPIEGGAAGSTTGFTSELLAARENLIADWIIDRSVPAVFALAGGYVGSGVSIDDVVGLHLLTIREFARIARSR